MHKSAGTDDKKLQTALKKLNVQPIQAIEEVNMFKADGNVIHFSAPKGTSIISPISQANYTFPIHIRLKPNSPSRRKTTQRKCERSSC